jgi:hypothetical protein
MENLNQQPQCPDKAGMDHFTPGFYGLQDSAYYKMAEKFGTRLHGSKTGIDYEVIETFYFSLFPVTCRDWQRNQ